MKAMKTQLLLLILLFEITLTALFCDPALAAETGATAKAKQPHIVLVYGDDVDCETVFGQFPEQDPDGIPFENLKVLAEQGVRFSNFHVTTPVCGPSRACLYTGQYAHRNGCRVNDTKSIRAAGFVGGYTTFNPNHELALWMKKSGYITAHVGKYLHADFKPDYKKGIYWKHIVPPGWDHFRLSLGSNYLNFPCYIKSTDQFIKSTGDEYRTDWDIRNAIGILQKHANGNNRDKPLMLCWSPIAAHITGNGQPMVAPRHKSLYTDLEIPELEKRLSQTVKNQIDEMSQLDSPPERKLDYMNDVFRDRLRAMKSIDEGIGTLREELENLGMLENTIFIVTSDHGFRFAQHRHFGKRLPYDRITRVPFLVSGPGIPRNMECDKLLANIDIAPTLVELSGQRPPSTCDGKSFANLMANPAEGSSFDRDAILIENWGEAVSHKDIIPATYNSMRMQNSVYTEWASGGREFFDLQTDPEQNYNLYDELDEEQQQELASKLRGLRKTDARPSFANTHFDRDNDSTRICASLMPVTLSGTIESDAGTERVELEFRCQKTGEFWTGSGWSKGRYGFSADLKQPGGLTSDWVFKLDTNKYSTSRHANLAARNIDVSLVAIDSAKRKTEEKAMSFSLAFADPETTIDSFNVSSEGADRLSVYGRAVDLQRVAAVRVGFQDPTTKLYWNGKRWKKEYCHLEANISATGSSQSQTNWSLDIPTPETPRLIIIARAYNRNTLFDHTPALKHAVLETGK
jgi:arylsulfatase A-like enzyme